MRLVSEKEDREAMEGYMEKVRELHAVQGEAMLYERLYHDLRHRMEAYGVFPLTRVLEEHDMTARECGWSRARYCGDTLPI